MIHKKLFALSAVIALAGTFAFGSTVQVSALDRSEEAALERQKKESETSRTEIQDRITTMRENQAEKLDAKRLAVCEKRQSKINAIVTRGNERNEKQLAVFQKIEAKVIQFYEDKQLSSEGYDAAVTLANEKEAAVLASIQVSSETTFDCNKTDGAAPANVVRELMRTRHEALKDYRSAIKDLIVVVKKAHGQQQTSETDARNNTNSTEEQ